MLSPLRVLLLVENNIYPFDFRVRREAQALINAGYKVTIIAPRGPAQLWIEEIEGVAVYRFPALFSGSGVVGYAVEFGYNTLVMLLLTIWIAIRKGVDVIHAGNPPDTLCMIGIIFKLFGKRFIFDQHDLAPETYLSRFEQQSENTIYKVLCLIERISYKAADVVIVTNESYKQMAIKRGSKKEDEVFIVRNGPPLTYQLLEPYSDLACRANFLIGYIGTIGPQDGLDYWMHAIHSMVYTLGRHDFLAIIIGTGDALSSVQVLAKELNIEAYVLFTGRLTELESRKYLSAVDVCVQPDPLNPLNDKSTMNKLMEYMALGKPTVTFDLLETRFTAQGAATYVQPNDELEFAKRVIWLLDNPDECKKMGEIGSNRVSTSLAWEYSEPKLLQAYNKACEFISAVR